MANQVVVFPVRCKVCGQYLSAKTVESAAVFYVHDNPSDCIKGDETVKLPEVSPEQLAALFDPKKKAAAKSPKK